MSLTKLFNPRSVALIGASAEPHKVGYAMMVNLLAGKNRKIFPVSLSTGEILGQKTYQSVTKIPDEVDLAVIAVKAEIVPEILEECGKKKIPFAIVIASGFRETGLKGLELEQKVVKTAEKNKIRLLGPNCLGLMNDNNGLNATFIAEKPLKGKIALLTQSGALIAALIDMGIKNGVGFSKLVSMGNEADLTEVEFLEYLSQDPDTKAILIYLEKLTNGPDFIKVASKVTRTKPIVVLRAGRSQSGLKAVMSHTGSLAPDDQIFEAACHQAGIITVDSIRSFFVLAKLFQLGIEKPLQRLAVISNGGGISALTADQIDFSHSLCLADFSPTECQALKTVMPPMASIKNPLDIIGDALSSRYRDALKIVAKDPGVDGIILMLTPQMMTEVEKTAKLVTEYRHLKPIIPVFMGGPTIEAGWKELISSGLTNYDFPKGAIEALDVLAKGANKPVLHQPVINLHQHQESTKMLGYFETHKLLKSVDIELSGIFIADRTSLPKAYSHIIKSLFDKHLKTGLALKVFSSEIVHKSESGAVKLNLTSQEDLEKAWDEIKTKNSHHKIDGMLVQPMVTGTEMIIGMKRDRVFGPAVMIGLGGIYTELIKDVSLQIAPVTLQKALEMISELKASKILHGWRGQPASDLAALATILVKISRLALKHPEIKEIDLNPVIATPHNSVVVDARILI